MTIDVILLGLQTFFLGVYAFSGILRSIRKKKTHWFVVLGTFSGLAVLCFFGENFIEAHVQIIILALLVLNYISFLFDLDEERLEKTIGLAGLVFMAYAPFYLGLELPQVWMAGPFIFMLFFGLISIRFDFLKGSQDYFLKVGTLLTLLFLLEPSVDSVQQNLKPIATIPISSIVNQQNALLLAVLIILVLGGFLWKENQSSKSNFNQ